MMIRIATPVIKPVMTEKGMKRVIQPRRQMPRINSKTPIRITRVTRTVPREAEVYPSSVSPVATARALVVETLIKTELVKMAPTGIASISVYNPNTGLTAASRACAMDCGMFTRAKVSPAMASDTRLPLSGLIFLMASALFNVYPSVLF